MSQTTAQLISNLVQALAFESTSAAPDNGVYLSAANTLAFNTNAAASPRLTIDSDGKLLVGTSSSISGANLQVVDTTSCALVLARNDTSIVEGNSIGEIRFFNNDSTSYEECANIAAVADGTYADGDKPTRLVFSTTADGGSSPTEKMRISANGNLTVDTDTFFVDAVNDRVGVGTTSPTATLHIAGGTARPALYMFGSDKDIGYNSVLQFGEWDGTTYTERMRIDSSGRLLVGTNSDITADVSSILQGVHASGGALNLARNDSSVSTNNTIGRIRFWGNAENGTWQECAQISAQADGTHGNSDKPTRLVFSTTADGAASPTERLNIDSLGKSAFSCAATATGVQVSHPGGSGNSRKLFLGRHSTSTESFIVWTNGDVQNLNDSYGAISDIKLKENIVDAESQWDDFKAVRFRKYNFKEETGHETFTQLGVIAQELELVSPGLVTETPDLDEEGNNLGTTTKSVKYSVLTKKALVALQEAMERIETLEAEVTALKGA